MKRNTIKILGISASVLLLMTGCGKVPKLSNGKDAVVTLKAGDIAVDDVYNRVKERYALTSLLELVDTEILDKEYKTTDEIEKDVKNQIDSMVKQYANGDEQAFLEQAYNAWGVDTMDELTEYMTLQHKRNKAVEDYAKSLVSDDDINKYYDEKIFGDISAKHILITPEVSSSGTDQEKKEAEEKALKEAKEVINKLNNGEDWDKLAKEYSDDESNKEKGGLLPDFTRGSMVEDFENAALELEKGKYTTEPVKTQYGYHIIYKLDQKDKPELKTVKDDIIETLGKEKTNDDATIQVTALEELRKKYKMNIQDDSLKDQYERYIKNYKKQLSNQ